MSGPGAVIAGKFRLEHIIGRGGMGAVWQARHLQLDMPVAVKFMEGSAAVAPDARQRFEREAKAAAQLRSPHVVQVLDHGVDDESPYIVMELLEGEDLGVRLKRQRRLPLAAIDTILTQTAKGLRRAHELGIIHRDLKPSNIFLARIDDEETVKVLDFGVAKLRWTNALVDFTQTGTLLGSPSYMSPEQARAHRAIDHRSDLWSLAVIVFRAITGEKPFVGDSIGELIVKLCIDPPPVASETLPGLPPAIDEFFARAFEQDPDRRYQTAPEMAAAFSAIVRTMSADATAIVPAPAPVAPGSPVRREPGSVTPPSDSRPLLAEELSLGRAALAADLSRRSARAGATAPFEPTTAFPMPLAGQGAASAPPTETAPLPDPEMAPYLAGGMGGPAQPIAPIMDPPQLPYPADAAQSAVRPPRPLVGPHNTLIAFPAGVPAHDSSAPGGGGTLTTTSRTLDAAATGTRRLIVGAALAAAITAVLVAIVLFASTPSEPPSGSTHAGGVETGERPPEPQPQPQPQVEPTPTPAAQPPEPPASADPQPAPPAGEAPTEPGSEPQGSPGAAPGTPGAPRPPTRYPPGGSTKKRPGVDLGY